MNEDIFMPPVSAVGQMKTMDSDIQEISEQIHLLLLQVRQDQIKQLKVEQRKTKSVKDA